MNDIIDALGDKKNATIQVEDDHAMTSEGVAIETSYDAKSSSDYSTIWVITSSLQDAETHRDVEEVGKCL